MTLKLLTEHHLEFLSLKGGFTGSSESALVTMPHCWKSHVMAHNMIWVLNEMVLSSTHIDIYVWFEIREKINRYPYSEAYTYPI